MSRPVFDINRDLVQPLALAFEKAGYFFQADCYPYKNGADLLDCIVEANQLSYEFTLAVKEHNGLLASLVHPAPRTITQDDEIYKNPLAFPFGAFRKYEDVEQRKSDVKDISQAVIGRFKHLGLNGLKM